MHGSPRVAWLGLGQMGSAMAANIVRNGSQAFSQPMILYNRTASRAEDLAAKLGKGKAIVAKSVEEAVEQADIIFAIVSNDAASEETVTKAIKSGVERKLYVDCSTVAPETTTKISKMILDAGGDFVAMPIFGAAAVAEEAQLVCVPCGPRECVDRVRPFLLNVIGREVIDLSDQPYGRALQLKVIGNSFVLNMVEALAEGHVLAEKCGLGGSNLHRFVEAMLPGAHVSYSKRMITGDLKRKDPAFHVDHARKDARHAIEMGEVVGVEMHNTRVVDGQLAKLQYLAPRNGVTGDLAQLYDVARNEAGLTFKP